MSTAEREQLATLAAEGKTAVEIAVAMNRSFQTINSAVWRLKIPVRHKCVRWSEEQDRVLKEAVRQGKGDAAIGDLVGRSADAVHSRIGILGGRALILYPAGPSAPLPSVKAQPKAVKLDPYHLWTRANARLQAQRETQP